MTTNISNIPQTPSMQSYNLTTLANFNHARAGFAPPESICGGGKGASNFVFSAIILWKPIPTPSITARSTAHPIAEFRAALTPPRTASEPPVKNPAIIALYGSSFPRTPLTAQSNVEKRPPHLVSSACIIGVYRASHTPRNSRLVLALSLSWP